MEYKDINHLIDYYSKWIKVKSMANKTVQEVIELKGIFAVHGIT